MLIFSLDFLEKLLFHRNSLRGYVTGLLTNVALLMAQDFGPTLVKNIYDIEVAPK